MAARIVLVRHAETAANAAKLWQGATNSSFSPRGQHQLRHTAARLKGLDPKIVVASDLGRAEASAGALGFDFDTDPRWREPSVGMWEGLDYREISERYPDDLAAMLKGEDVALGGAERLSAVSARLNEAFEDLVDHMDGEGTAIVVSHGISMLTLVASLLGTTRPAPVRLMGNMGLTTIHVGERGIQLTGYNDRTHLDEDLQPGDGESHVVLVRHGRTTANVEERWQGHGDWPLDGDGVGQAGRLASVLPRFDVVYSSPLSRAAATAAAVADRQGTEVEFDEGLKEIGFGSWENLTTHEIATADPEGWQRLMSGEDLVRGGSGETFLDVRQRVSGSIERMVGDHPGETIGAFSHGGATRAYMTGVLGLTFPERHRLRSLRNTATARVVYGAHGPRLASWNTGSHLPDLIADAE